MNSYRPIPSAHNRYANEGRRSTPLPPKVARPSGISAQQSKIPEGDIQATLAAMVATNFIAPGRLNANDYRHVALGIVVFSVIGAAAATGTKNAASEGGLQHRSGTDVAVRNVGYETGIVTPASPAGPAAAVAMQSLSNAGFEKKPVKNTGNPIDKILKPTQNKPVTNPGSTPNRVRAEQGVPSNNTNAMAQECTGQGTGQGTGPYPPATKISQATSTIPPSTTVDTPVKSEIEKMMDSVKKRLIIDPGLNKKDCANIETAYRAALTMEGYDKIEITNSLNPASRLRIRCANGKSLPPLVEAGYDPKFHTLLFPARIHLPPHLFFHESNHIENFVNHYGKKCFEKKWPETFSAVYPHTKKESDEFIADFHTGFDRLRAFKACQEKKANGQILSPAEKNTYARYWKALETCLLKPAHFHFPIQKEEYERNPVGRDTLFGLCIKIYQTDHGKYNAIMECTSPAKFIDILLFDIGDLASNEYTGALETAETEAWALQRMSIKARQVFFPEAMEKRAMYRARCT